MAKYLLLRNNKESGPYSTEQLVQLGLKPYDLVWIEGKSAAWRYPSEVPELKPFAPVVEEQPFDRFFKKPAESEKTSSEIPAQPVKEQVDIPASPVNEKAVVPREDSSYGIAAEHEKYIPRKSVFVKMPGSKPASEVSRTPHEAVKTKTFTEETIPAKTVEKRPARQAIPDTDDTEPEVKYSQPLDEIKQMYVKTLQERKKRIAKQDWLVKNAKRAAVILLLIGVGVVGGFLINSGSRNGGPQAPAVTPVETAAATQPGDDQAGSNMAQPEQEVIPPSVTSKINFDEPPEMLSKPVAGDEDILGGAAGMQEAGSSIIQPRGAAINANTGERNGVTRSGTDRDSEGEKRPAKTVDLSDYVTVRTNDFKKVAFGGIRNLELTVTNDSKFTLDNVFVELQYIKPNELPLKTERIEFGSIAPNSASTLRIPDTNRGVKIAYRIVQINSRQFNDVAAGR